MEKLLKFLGASVVMVVSFVLNGYAVQNLWQWFVVPIFALPLLGFLQAVGLTMTTRYMCSRRTCCIEPDDVAEKRMTYSILFPLTALAVGWVIKSFM